MRLTYVSVGLNKIWSAGCVSLHAIIKFCLLALLILYKPTAQPIFLYLYGYVWNFSVPKMFHLARPGNIMAQPSVIIANNWQLPPLNQCTDYNLSQ